MKIVTHTANGFMVIKTTTEMKVFWEKMGHEVFPYFVADHEEDVFRHGCRHFQMYSNVLNYAEGIGADLLWFDNLLSVPEYLLAELRARPNYKPKVAFMFSFRESYKSKARAKVLKDLIDMPQVKFALIESLLGDKIIPPDNWLELNPNMNKCKFIYDRINEELQELKKDKKESREKYGLPLDKFILLFFARITYGKGIDILAEAMKQLPDVFLFVKASTIGNDFIWFAHEVFNKMPNVKFIDDWTPQEELGYVYSSCDVVITPYRKTYTYGTSGIPCQAILADRLCIVPNIYPIDEYSKKFKLGPIFESENIDSLIETIKYTKENYENLMKQTKFENCMDDLTTMEQISNYIVGEI